MKKILCIFLSVVLMIPFAIMCFSASEAEFETYEIQGVDALRFPEDTPVKVKTPAVKSRLFASKGLTNSADEPFKFYTQLTNDMQRLIYNALVSKRGGLDLVTNDNATEIQLNISEDNSNWYFSDQAGLNALAENAFDAIVPALTAFAEDYPQYFWIIISYNGASFSYESGGSRYKGILILKFNAAKTDAYPTWGVIKDYYNRMLVSIDNFAIEGYNRYEKLKSIHDQIVDKITYDPNYNNSNKNPTNHEPVAVFNSPYLAVCEGYAEAFKLLCDKAGIPCITVTGTAGGGHKWNYVKMEDGNWYAVDVTWDDPMGNTDQIYYDYFIVGNDTAAPFFENSVFSEHIPTGTLFQSDEFALSYPTLSTVSYVGGCPMRSSVATFNNPKGFMFIPKNAVLNEQFVATHPLYSSYYKPSDHTVTISGGSTTGATVSITNTNSSAKTYTVVRWGDITADNQVNNNDYLRAKTVLQGTYNLNSEAKLAAGDFNGDGVIDAFDMFHLDKYIRS